MLINSISISGFALVSLSASVLSTKPTVSFTIPKDCICTIYSQFYNAFETSYTAKLTLTRNDVNITLASKSIGASKTIDLLAQTVAILRANDKITLTTNNGRMDGSVTVTGTYFS